MSCMRAYALCDQLHIEQASSVSVRQSGPAQSPRRAACIAQSMPVTPSEESIASRLPARRARAQRQPDRPGALPPEFKRPHIKARTGADGQQLWTPGRADPAVRLQVLRWLARQSDSPLLGTLAAADWHRVFTEDAHNSEDEGDPVNECIRLRAGQGISTRSGGYPSVTIGSVGISKSRRESVKLDAHRLVCWLTRGPPETEQASFAIHSCHHKDCVKSAHLSWDTQQENLRQTSERRSASRSRSLGVFVCAHQPVDCLLCVHACSCSSRHLIPLGKIHDMGQE